ncbi:putative ABC transporter ATP-binding protein YbhF [Pseudovibrio sp. WM33]|nr:putative ABC transporter ATP-binding protein YbhF [Pseudovibrio sp. WM33]
MHKPKLLLLDEPTAGVDPKARRDFWEEIHHLAADGMTVLVSTHYMDEAERCHRITYISYGELLADGSLSDVIADAGLYTYTLTGPNLERFIPQLQENKGVQQVAPFGNSLHVTGTDLQALKRALKPLEQHEDIRTEQSETNLEDVFIKFMSDSTDNMQ